jgi:hypothetical protein
MTTWILWTGTGRGAEKMFQPRVKLEFVRRYLGTPDWNVFVDVDASEEGRTGGERKSAEAKDRQRRMGDDFAAVRAEVENLKHVRLGKRSSEWERSFSGVVGPIAGDRDIIGVRRSDKRIVIVEVEGESSGQPEQKVYKAVGQAVAACSAALPDGFAATIGVVVYGEPMGKHLRGCSKLKDLGIFGLRLDEVAEKDEWLFGRPNRI